MMPRLWWWDGPVAPGPELGPGQIPYLRAYTRWCEAVFEHNSIAHLKQAQPCLIQPTTSHLPNGG